MASSKQKSDLRIALVSACAVVLAAVIGIPGTCNNSKTPNQAQEVKINNNPAITISFDSNTISGINTVRPEINKEEAPPVIYTRNPTTYKFSQFISEGEGYVNNIRGNEEKIKKWEKDCLAKLEVANEKSTSEYKVFTKYYNGNPPEKNIVDTLLQLMKIEENKLSN